MKFSIGWLREWVDPPISTAELAEQLTMAGLEVEAVTPAADLFEGVVVGEVLAVEPYPYVERLPVAERLTVCQVDVGDAKPLQIVCGAPTVRMGLRVATARVGARLPGDRLITKVNVRGVESSGMLCSAQELGLAESTDALLELPPDAPVGSELYKYLGLKDQCLELDLTPNRGDCLGIAGIAREVGVVTRCPVGGPRIEAVPARIPDILPVELESPAPCPHYVGRVIRGINPRAPTPLWMKERLRRGGVRSLGAVVDVTNYVLLELGQPMHVFDLAKLAGGIRVRLAWPGERLTLLDGQSLTLDDKDLVIADRNRAQALAGVMGGLDSSVSESTDSAFLESAYFAPEVIASQARHYGLHSESSHRFERGVDPALQRTAAERATALLVDIVGGEPGPLIEVSSDKHLPRCACIRLRPKRIERVLTVAMQAEEVVDILSRLGMHVEADGDGWQVTPPSARFDIAIEADLIEELGRIYGFSRLPVRQARITMALAPRAEGKVARERILEVLVNRGYQEAVTYSFVAPELQRLLDPECTAIPLANPLSADLSVMRTSLWPGLLQVFIHNRNRQQSRVRLFETGLRFYRQDEEIIQESSIAGVAFGTACAEQWSERTRPMDFYDLKADVEALLQLTRQAAEFTYSADHHPALHPGQCARIDRGGSLVGWLGALHPALEEKLQLDGRVYLFELRLHAIQERGVPIFKALSKFPAIRRDIAVVVDETVSAQTVQDYIASAVPGVLRELCLFDVYRGKGVEAGRKSLAFGLILQDSSRTLTDENVAAIIGGVVAHLHSELGASLRE
jgi:phenylalanyl-tRNA synthetase, beta subunit, non-spirochete bacterial